MNQQTIDILCAGDKLALACLIRITNCQYFPSFSYSAKCEKLGKIGHVVLETGQ